MAMNTPSKRGGLTVDAFAASAGIAAPLVYAITVVIGSASTPGYDAFNDSISSLTDGSRSGSIWLQCGFALYNGLVVLFAIGALSTKRAVPWRIVYGLYLVTAICGLLMWPFTQDPTGEGISAGGAIHIALAAVESLSSIAILALSVRQLWAARLGVALFAAFCLAMTLAFGFAAAMATAAQWPLMGLYERVTVGSFEVWTLVLGVMMLRRPGLLASAPVKP